MNHEHKPHISPPPPPRFCIVSQFSSACEKRVQAFGFDATSCYRKIYATSVTENLCVRM
jgi:hypothetical protein